MRGENMLVILFRSKLTADAGQDYGAMSDELHALVRENPGFVDVRHYTADDGERLTVAWFKDKDSLRQWRTLPRHREAQSAGRQKWYEYYKMEVATVERVSEFERTPHAHDTEGDEDQARGPRPVGIDSPA
jgi:heme-degrading monooxygenase HmoA